jgi:hypothetical protein
MALFCGSLLALVSGCAQIRFFDVPVKPTPLPACDKLPLHAVLVLGKDLTDYQYRRSFTGMTWAYRLGPPLQDYARRTASDWFQQVDEARSSEEATARASADIVLTPRPVKLTRTTGLRGNNNATLTFVMQWTAEERASHNTVWLRTVTAEATEFQGTQFTILRHELTRLQKLFDDLSVKTHEAFGKAPELRNIPH